MVAIDTLTDRASVVFARLSTSAKLIFILSLALLPLGAIALLASLSSARSADAQRRSDLRVAVSESSRKLSAELATDIAIMRESARMVGASSGTPGLIADEATVSGVCARLKEVLQSRPTGGVAFAVFQAGPLPICSTAGAGLTRPSTRLGSAAAQLRPVSDGIEIALTSPQGDAVVIAHYPNAALAEFARPTGYGSPYALSLTLDGADYELSPEHRLSAWEGTDRMTMATGIGGLSLTMAISVAPFGAAEALLTFLPLLMWASAAAVAFYVVDRLLIRPLKALRLSVARYEPGSTQRLLAETPAIEISELEDSFAAFADRLADREKEVAAALAAQVKLTREVHHRVKNNLQVIASLISLHARGSQEPAALTAFASIQRRVDALSIVHRNHFAELEANRGIEVKALLSELVANFRATADNNVTAPPISIACDRLCVGQDVAMPLAFLITEIAEMALFADPSASIEIEAAVAAPGRATLSIHAAALVGIGQQRAGPGARIIEGLARQLRSKLVFDAAAGRYEIEFPADV